MLTLATMNRGLASTFVPFRCTTRTEPVKRRIAEARRWSRRDRFDERPLNAHLRTRSAQEA
jgi:hypothetical protein